MLTAAAVLTLAMVLALQLPPSPLAAAVRSSIDAARLERLETWLAAGEAHQPGRDDAAARRIAAWPRAYVEQVRLDLRPVLILMRDRDVSVFQTETATGIPTMLIYGQRELEALGALASARGRDVNRVLKRGAMLHTDIGLLVPLAERQAPSANSFTLHFGDGRALSVSDTAGHWAMARALLDRVVADPESDTPAPGRDEMVRLWYRAMAAHFMSTAQLDTDHFARALVLFPRDADMLLLAGAFHETLAAPAVRDVMAGARLPDGAKFRIGSERDELQLARELFERALEIAPGLGEARIRLGHVLGRLGRAPDAIDHLTRAKSQTSEPLLLYFAELLLGRETDAAGRRAEAIAAYERASAIYPRAQSPRLALSELAARRGERNAAVAAAQAVLASQPDGSVDPWWSYYASAGRSASQPLRELLMQFATASPSGAVIR